MTDANMIKENSDGSATYSFDFTEEEQIALFRAGVIQALKAGIKEAEQYSPEKESKTFTKSVELTWDQLESIVISELQDAYRFNSRPGVHEDGKELVIDNELLHSLERVLEYFMPKYKFDEWRSEND